ncbi:unnamed protein product [Leptosia nina]|uniref:C2H2-type domain-containing protein n=1 Tax=Leptosia nina TaxID=320188 RepID=A0AAV1JI81_9NEOP
MLLFPSWRPELHEGCRVPRWISAEGIASYVARPVALPALPRQIEDGESCGSLSPERQNDSGSDNDCICEWRGCGARFDTVTRLSAHVARNHAHAHADGFFYCCWKGCTRSERGFNARYKMIVHMRIHTNERPHTCNQCQKSFSRAENLKIHLRSHSGEKPYVCPYEGCGKAYSNSSDRFKHTRTHKVDKPYCCKAFGCNKRYTDPSSLRKHVKAYKHFTNEKDSPKRETSPPQRFGSLSPMREYLPIPPTSPQDDRLLSPTFYPPVPSEPFRAPLNYMTMMNPAYIRHVDNVYTREPSQDTFAEYSKMYDQTYRHYYTVSGDYPILKPMVKENYTYEKRIEDVSMSDQVEYLDTAKDEYDENVPLNLMCAKRLDCKPIEPLVRNTELPLDLSTKN